MGDYRKNTKEKRIKNNFCIDCGKLIWKSSIRCGSCSKKGENHPFCNKKHSKKTREKMKENNTRYWLGKKFSKKTRKKMSKTHQGDKNPMWKGDKVGYFALHTWIERNKPKPKFCERCKVKPPIDLANISGKYKREINDFEWICRSCHMNKDKRINNLKQYRK